MLTATNHNYSVLLLMLLLWGAIASVGVLIWRHFRNGARGDFAIERWASPHLGTKCDACGVVDSPLVGVALRSWLFPGEAMVCAPCNERLWQQSIARGVRNGLVASLLWAAALGPTTLVNAWSGILSSGWRALGEDLGWLFTLGPAVLLVLLSRRYPLSQTTTTLQQLLEGDALRTNFDEALLRPHLGISERILWAGWSRNGLRLTDAFVLVEVGALVLLTWSITRAIGPESANLRGATALLGWGGAALIATWFQGDLLTRDPDLVGAITDRRVLTVSRGKVTAALLLEAVRSIGIEGGAVVFKRRQWPAIFAGPPVVRFDFGGDPRPLYEALHAVLSAGGTSVAEAISESDHDTASTHGPAESKERRNWVKESIRVAARLRRAYGQLERHTQLALWTYGAVVGLWPVMRSWHYAGPFLTTPFVDPVPTRASLSVMGAVVVYSLAWGVSLAQGRVAESPSRVDEDLGANGHRPSPDQAANLLCGGDRRIFTAALLDMERLGYLGIEEMPSGVLRLARGATPAAFLNAPQRALGDSIFADEGSLRLSLRVGKHCDVLETAMRRHARALDAWSTQVGYSRAVAGARHFGVVLLAAVTLLIMKLMSGMPTYVVVSSLLVLGVGGSRVSPWVTRMQRWRTPRGWAAVRLLEAERRELSKMGLPDFDGGIPGSARHVQDVAYALGLQVPRGLVVERSVSAVLTAGGGRWLRRLRRALGWLGGLGFG